jgi:hypothetical protein
LRKQRRQTLADQTDCETTKAFHWSAVGEIVYTHNGLRQETAQTTKRIESKWFWR